MHVCAKSTGLQYIIGHPPAITCMPCARPYSTADSDMLPRPTDRWSQARGMPHAAHSRMTRSESSDAVTTMARLQILESPRTGDRA